MRRVHRSRADGIEAKDHSSPTVARCAIFGHTRAGLRLGGTGRPQLARNAIESNRAEGILCTDRSASSLQQCTVSENLKVGVMVEFKAHSSIVGCEVTHIGTMLAAE